ncbi:MAG: hypothetical protein FWD83_08710 [Promicromonosporaceae bacterium]|nr:hypothetical protein [Promicromonosporaceae bacterium]
MIADPSLAERRAGSWPGKPRLRGARSAPSGFAYTEAADGTVRITHDGRMATILRGARAGKFLAEVVSDPQQVMARWTGNYRRGNERIARQHPRNRGR